jgi:hypothetical protein
VQCHHGFIAHLGRYYTIRRLVVLEPWSGLDAMAMVAMVKFVAAVLHARGAE